MKAYIFYFCYCLFLSIFFNEKKRKKKKALDGENRFFTMLSTSHCLNLSRYFSIFFMYKFGAVMLLCFVLK